MVAVGPAILSNCGFLEGDSLSCVAMCVANTAFHLHMSQTGAPIRTLTFVDNYESTSATYDGLVQAHSALMDFSRSWDMPVDTGKTVAWCTAAEGRSRLRAAGFQVVLDFRDLGAHLQTSRRYSNRTQVDRILSLDDRWPTLAASHAPVAQKIRALSMAAWPSALHAISVTPVGECHFSRLRSKAMRGITLNAPGANPMLQLSLVEYPVADSFFFTLRSSFMDLKCLAGPEVVGPLLTAAAQAAVREPGPAALLVAVQMQSGLHGASSPGTSRMHLVSSTFGASLVLKSRCDCVSLGNNRSKSGYVTVLLSRGSTLWTLG